MRYHKPDIIVILAVLVGIGIVVTTTAQAAQTGQAPAPVMVADNSFGALNSTPCNTCPRILPEQHQVSPQFVETTAYYFDWPNSLLDGFDARTDTVPYRDAGVSYDFMFNKFRAVMRTGSGIFDVTLRLDNMHHPDFMLDPYFSISLGSRW